MASKSIAATVRARRGLILACILASCLLALLLLSIYVIPNHLIARDLGDPGTSALKPSELLKATDDARKTLLQGIGGLLFLATAFFTYQQLKVSRDSHTTEQFTKAIEHLGSERVDVRVGGIYALERIARASRDRRERAPVIEILTAYVREHAAVEGHRNEPKSIWAFMQQWLDFDQSANEVEDADPTTIGHLDADVHAALLVLARRPSPDNDAILILAQTDLRRAHLAAPKVAVAQLSRANLQEALLQIANLEGANLARADLWQADLRWSNLQAASLEEAHLHAAKLRGADLRKANLRKANLQTADLQEADLREADLRSANLAGADLTGARLDGANLTAVSVDSNTRWPADLPSGTLRSR